MKNLLLITISCFIASIASAQITKGGKTLPREYTIDTFTREVTKVLPTQTNNSGYFFGMYYTIANPSSALKALPEVGTTFSDMYTGNAGIGMKSGWRFGMKAQWLLPGINQHMIRELDWGMNWMLEVGANSFSLDGIEGTGNNWTEANVDYKSFWDFNLSGFGPNLTFHTPIKGMDVDLFSNFGVTLITGGGFENTATNERLDNFDGTAVSITKTFGISLRYSSLYFAVSTKSYNFNNNQFDYYKPRSSKISSGSIYSKLPMNFTNLSFGFAFPTKY